MMLLVLLMAWAGAAAALAQDYSHLDLPPSEQSPRARDEWQAEQAASRALGSSFYEVYPDWADEFRAMLAHSSLLYDRYRDPAFVCDAGAADELVFELFADWGHPALNSRHQELLLLLIHDLTAYPPERLPADARRTLAAGLTRYAQAGGAQSGPAMQARLAQDLALLSADDFAEQAQAERLLNDALDWALAIDSEPITDSVARICAAHFGDGFWLEYYERATLAQLPSERPAAYERAVALLAALLRDEISDVQWPRRLREAVDAASRRLDAPALREDLLTRVLLVYQLLLRRGEDSLPAECVARMERHLSALFAESWQTDDGPLHGEPLWRSWGKAVARLKGRISDDFARRIERAAIAPDLEPPIRGGLDWAKLALPPQAQERITAALAERD